MQRLYSTFANAGPGKGLFILRLAISAFLISDARTALLGGSQSGSILIPTIRRRNWRVLVPWNMDAGCGRSNCCLGVVPRLFPAGQQLAIVAGRGDRRWIGAAGAWFMVRRRPRLRQEAHLRPGLLSNRATP